MFVFDQMNGYCPDLDTILQGRFDDDLNEMCGFCEEKTSGVLHPEVCCYLPAVVAA
jgi:hypothetical protein